MEAMSNEGPHIRDYEQKSEKLWNEAPQNLEQNIWEYNIFKKKKNAILEHSYMILIKLKWSEVLNNI